jgi:uncharacterized radical SAM superfamily Fe-S cluster-containing enzyme
MVKDCPKHGHFEDVMSIDPEFSRHLEEVFPGRDIRAHNDEKLHHHGSSTVKYGRGSVLTIDLTNRCNMMCDPCFMDANQVGFVHELSWQDIKTMLDNAITIKPRRQMSVQFSGGEPTLSPYFLDAIRYAQKGWRSVWATRNRFVKVSNSHRPPKEALRLICTLTVFGNAPTPTAKSVTVRRKAESHRQPAQSRRRNRSGRNDRQRHQQRTSRTHHPVRAG